MAVGACQACALTKIKEYVWKKNKTEEKCPKIPFVRVGIKDINGNSIQASSFPESLLRKSKQDNKELVKII